MKKLFTVLLLVFVGFQPVIGQTKKEAKETKKQQEYEAAKELINSKQYEFTGDWATSNSGKRINLISNPTYIKIDNSSADGYLPFFGRAFSGAGYGSDGAIEFKDPLENYKVEIDDNKQIVNIKFNAKGDKDKYDVTMRVFGSGSATITINSNNRSTMTYSGKIKTLEKKE